MIWQGDASSSGSAKNRSRREGKSFGQEDLQQVQSNSPQGRGAGVVREHQAQATARLINGSSVQKSKGSGEPEKRIFVLKLQKE
jgi:hypothetical protein